jgi:hypothetical protein
MQMLPTRLPFERHPTDSPIFKKHFFRLQLTNYAILFIITAPGNFSPNDIELIE